MIGIGHKQQKYTKIKILSEKAKQYNKKYDDLIAQGLDPQQVASKLQKEEYDHRHTNQFVQQPYKISSKMNQIGGAVHLGYTNAHKTLSQTQNFYAPMEETVKCLKSGTKTGFSIGKTKQQIQQHKTLKQRIQKDHLAQDHAIDLGEKINTDYKRHFNDDNRMKQMRQHKDKQFHARKNELNWYVQTYIKTKQSLRKC